MLKISEEEQAVREEKRKEKADRFKRISSVKSECELKNFEQVKKIYQHYLTKVAESDSKYH